MEATIDNDCALRRLLQPLMSVRHAHLRPLLAVRITGSEMSLHYGQPQLCERACDGLRGAMLRLHAAGLWIGELVESLGLDDRGRVVLSGVGSQWDLTDPFAGHPCVKDYDLRVAWRQRGDELQLQAIDNALTRCA